MTPDWLVIALTVTNHDSAVVERGQSRLGIIFGAGGQLQLGWLPSWTLFFFQRLITILSSLASANDFSLYSLTVTRLATICTNIG